MNYNDKSNRGIRIIRGVLVYSFIVVANFDLFFLRFWLWKCTLVDTWLGGPQLLLPMAEAYYVGVDVGTASVRAALVTRDGLLKSTAEEPITIWKPQPEHYVQSSTEIWQKCCSVVKVGSRQSKRWFKNKMRKKWELVSKYSILDDIVLSS